MSDAVARMALRAFAARIRELEEEARERGLEEAEMLLGAGRISVLEVADAPSPERNGVLSWTKP